MLYFSFRKMHFISLFTIFSCLTLSFIRYENVAFHKGNEIALPTSKWLSTFLMDLKPHENFLNKLPEDLGKASITAHSIQQFYDFPSKQDYRGIIKRLKGEIVALQNGQHTLLENYIELHAIHTE